jgi:hypothetical protein
MAKLIQEIYQPYISAIQRVLSSPEGLASQRQSLNEIDKRFNDDPNSLLDMDRFMSIKSTIMTARDALNRRIDINN